MRSPRRLLAWRAWVAVLATSLLIGGLPAASADYGQPGVDAARTGTTSETGPERNDVAFRVELPGSMAGRTAPIIIDRDVFLVIQAADHPEMTTNGIVRVGLDTAQVEVLAETDDTPNFIVSDSQMLYVTTEGSVQAYPLSGGGPVWSWEFPELSDLPRETIFCVSPALADGSLYILCAEIASSLSMRDELDTLPGVNLPPPAVDAQVVTFAVALDTSTGDDRWVWVDDVTPVISGLPHPQAFDWGFLNHLSGVSVIENAVHLLYQEPGGEIYGSGDAYLRAFDPEGGELRWTVTHNLGSQATDAALTQDEAFLEGTSQFRNLGVPTGGHGEIYYAIRDLMTLNPENGEERWRHSLDQVDDDVTGGHAFALTENDLYVSSRGVLFKFDRTTQSLVWDRGIPAGEHFDDEPLVLAGGTLYGRTHFLTADWMTQNWEEDPSTITEYFYAFDPEDGNVRWRHGFHQDPDRYVTSYANQFTYALGQGVMAVQGVDGTLHVMGETGASLQPVIEQSTVYPEVREELRVDLSGTGAGAQGAATSFRAAWGDGTVTPWQDDPVFHHAYTSRGLHEAEFNVRNDAGQTATAPVTFHVGEDPPVEASWLARTFPAEVTLGILGVLVAVMGGVYGVAHQKQRRGRLQRELDAVEAIYQESRDDPRACISALNQRKGHARGLVVDGKLDETQFHVVRERIDDLRRRLRVPMVEDEWAFLPHSMVQGLVTMMEDGSVTRYERDAFLEKLERTKGLTKAQREKVCNRIEEWFREDAGGDG